MCVCASVCVCLFVCLFVCACVCMYVPLSHADSASVAGEDVVLQRGIAHKQRRVRRRTVVCECGGG